MVYWKYHSRSMEKDNLPEWLKVRAQEFKLNPPEGGFTVLMRKREQQRKQRKLFLWVGVSSAAAIMATSLWLIGSFYSIPSDRSTVAESRTLELTKEVSSLDRTHTSHASARHPENQTSSGHRESSDKVAVVAYPKAKTTFAIRMNTKMPTDYSPINTDESAGVIPSPSPNRMEQTSTMAIIVTDSTALEQPIDSLSRKQPADSSIISATKEVNVSPELVRNSYWSVSAVFTPQLMNSVYNTNSDATLSWMKKYIENREQNDKALYSFNTGIKVAGHFGNHWSMSGGVLFSKVQFEEIRIVNTIIPDSTGNEFGNLTAADKNNRITQVDQNSFDISFTSLEFPVQVAYQLQRNKMYCQLSAGVAYSYLFRTRSLVFDPSDSLNVQETDDAGNKRLNQHSLLLMGGVTIGYQIANKWSLFAGPVYRHSLHSIYSQDYIIRQQPYYLGIEFGVKYSFR